MRETVVFDFDGVIHSYTSGWQGVDVIPDPPVPGIKEAISQIRQSYRVVVVSARCSDYEGVKAISEWLEKHGIEVDGIMQQKPPAKCYIDDRAVCFDGNSAGLLAKIENFTPWHKREPKKEDEPNRNAEIIKIAEIMKKGESENSITGGKDHYKKFTQYEIFQYGCGRLNGASMIYDEGYRKQIEGEWKPMMQELDYFDTFECSICGEVIDISQGDYKYCPNCGARMKGE